MPFSACDGILEGIYDSPAASDSNEFGFIEQTLLPIRVLFILMLLIIDVWTFIDFHTQKVDSVNVTDSDQKEPEEWDIAVHRYDVKTNAGAVLETGFTGFSALQNASAMPEGVYVDDVWTTAKVAIDMSGMMDGNIVYMESYYNEELSKWLNVDKSNMPPTYTLSNKVYMVKLKDGTYAAVRLTNYMNASGVKGFMTIDYIYPFEL